MEILEKQLLFVSGKGGVGKSTVALAVAKHLSTKGRRVLLVELGKRSSVAALVGIKSTIQHQPMTTPFSFDLSLFSGKTCLSQYISYFTKFESLSKLFLDNRFMKVLLPLAPGLDDLATLGQLTAGLRQHGPTLDYDHIVVDAPSTGAFLSMLQAPHFLSGIVNSGPLYDQSRSIVDALNNSHFCHFIFVTLLESFPVNELLESTAVFQKQIENPFSVVVNKVVPKVEMASVQPKVFRDYLAQQQGVQELYLEKLRNQFQPMLKLDLLTESLQNLFTESPTCPLLHSL